MLGKVFEVCKIIKFLTETIFTAWGKLVVLSIPPETREYKNRIVKQFGLFYIVKRGVVMEKKLLLDS